MKALTLSLSIFLCTVIRVSAALSLTVNVSNETFWFSGSDTGNFTGSFPVMTESLVSSPNQFVLWDQSIITISTTSIWSGNFGANTNFDIVLGNFNSLTTGSATLTGTGATSSYAGFSAAGKTILEDLAIGGGTLNITNGANGFDAVQVAAVPEPATAAALIGMITSGFCALRRKRR